MANEINGKWQLAFWLMSGVLLTGLILLTTNVVANDRRNVDDHLKIRDEVGVKFDRLFSEIKTISERTARIEAKL